MFMKATFFSSSLRTFCRSPYTIKATTIFKISNQIKCRPPLSIIRSKMAHTSFGSGLPPNEPLLPYSVVSNSSMSSIAARQYSTESSTAKEELKRWSWPWWKEWAVIFIVFGITGSTTVRIVRPIVTNVFGIEGSFREGPWSYRLTYLSITLPLYSIILFCVGTLFRRQQYFKKIIFRMYGRFIPSRLIRKIRGIENP